MGMAAKKQSNSGMGFLFVFVPDEEDNNNKALRPFHSLLKPTNSSNLLHKAQSTISICALLFFFTLLLFTLSTLPSSKPHHFPPRFSTTPKPPSSSSTSVPPLPHALQGMGSLYRRGTSSMSELVVAHATESLAVNELKLFLRVFCRSGLCSRSDVVFIFPMKSPVFDKTILEENDSFLKLVNQSLTRSSAVTQFAKSSKKKNEAVEPIWGRGVGSNSTVSESTRTSYGSVVGFDVEDLDPDNSLSGFFDPGKSLPVSLRRWACYPMLLGRVRRNFKHAILVDIKEMLLSGDPLAGVRTQPQESVYFTTRHGKKTQSTQQQLANPEIIVGGAKGTRRLSNAMLTQIVRSAMQRKKKNSLSELDLFNKLVSNEFVLKKVNLIRWTEAVPELSSLTELNSKPGSYNLSVNHTLIRRGNSNKDVEHVVMKLLCLFSPDSTINSDC